MITNSFSDSGFIVVGPLQQLDHARCGISDCLSLSLVVNLPLVSCDHSEISVQDLRDPLHGLSGDLRKEQLQRRDNFISRLEDPVRANWSQGKNPDNLPIREGLRRSPRSSYSAVSSHSLAHSFLSRNPPSCSSRPSPRHCRLPFDSINDRNAVRRPTESEPVSSSPPAD